MAPTEEVEGEAEEVEGEAKEEEEEQDMLEKDGWLQLMGGAIRKRTLSAGEGSRPEMKMDAVCSYEVRLADSPSDEILQRRSQVRYRIGEGEAVPCLELGLRFMNQGEEAEIFGEARMAWGPTGLAAVGEGERAVPPDADVLLRVVLHECLEGEGAEASWNRKVQDITWRKENGNDHFRRKEYQKAARCYGFGLQVFQGNFEAPEDVANAQSASAMAMSLASDIGSNLAAVHLELGDATAAKEAATVALQMNPDHVKCLYRGAKACFVLDHFEECEVALQRALGLEPENAALRRLEAELKRKKQRYAEKSKRIAAKAGSIFSGLDYPEQRVPEAAQDEAPGALRAAGHAAVAWVQERRRYIAAGVLVWTLAAMLCLALPRRYWPYVFMVPTILFPTIAAVAASRAEGAAKPKKKKT